MAERYGTIQIRRERGKLVLIGMGKTGRGQSYIKRRAVINSPGVGNDSFKRELSLAVDELFAPPLLSD